MIGATTLVGGQTNPTTGQTKTGSDQDVFMKLLITQLQQQDPMNPLQPYELAAQLASFSTVQELSLLNQGLTTETSSVQSSTALTKTAFSAALIGRNVIADGNQVTIPDAGQGQILVDVGGEGGDAKLTLLDSSGKQVATRDLGSVAAGNQQTIKLPDDLPAGTYTYNLTVTGPDGTAASVKTYTTGTVDGVRFTDSQILLRIGTIEVPLESLLEIEPGPNQPTA